MLVAGNWKMNKNIKETILFFKKFNKLLKTKNKIVLFPSFPCIFVARNSASKTISIGAQNVFFEEKGEFTGEVSCSQLKPFCDFVILGHSDRRHKFFESNQLINKKIKKAFESKFKVILCVGETLKGKNKNKTNSVISNQLKQSLSKIKFTKNLFIAYEPVWAIGTGKNANIKDITKAHSFIQKTLVSLFGKKAEKTQILYGGSVKPENMKEIFSIPKVSGVLVGGASLNPKTFAKIANFK